MMRKSIVAFILLVTVTTTGLFYSGSAESSNRTDIYSGYYSRDGNDDRPARISGNSIYIKFYPDRWVVLLYVPYPYSKTLKPKVLHNVFQEIKQQIKGKSYIRGRFSFLSEAATAHIETYDMPEENKAVFECDGTAPCRVTFIENYMEMRKAGMLNDHIIRFNRINE